MSQFIGDKRVSDREYDELYERWEKTQPGISFQKWAKFELSPAGQRQREYIERNEEYERRNAKALRDQERMQDRERRKQNVPTMHPWEGVG